MQILKKALKYNDKNRVKRLISNFASSTKLPDLLQYKTDFYNSVHIRSSYIPSRVEEFEQKLEKSLKKWQEDKVKGIWIHIPIDKSNLIPIVVEKGFEFHHTKKDELVLSKWLPDRESKLPGYATHFCGVGGVCIREDKNQVLLIKEKNGPGRGKSYFLALLGFLSQDF